MSNYLAQIESFLEKTDNAIEESYLGEAWDSVKAATWDSPVNALNRAALEHVVVPVVAPVSKVLDAPLNAIQGGLTEGAKGVKRGLFQEQDYSYGQALPAAFQQQYPRTTGLFSNVTDTLLDPLNLIGAGGISKMTKAGDKLSDLGISDANFRGMYTSSPSNYIDNFYGIDNPNAPLTTFEQTMFDEFDNLSIERFNHLKDNEKTALAKRISGITHWAIDSLKGARDIALDPEAQALFAELGINKKTQDIVRAELANATQVARETGRKVENTRPFQKSVAQAIFNRLVPVQAGRKGKTSSAFTSIMDKSTLGGIGPLSKGRYIENVMEGHNVTKQVSGGKKRSVAHNTADLSHAYDEILDIWEMEDNSDFRLVVKKPTGTAGDHATDAILHNPSRNLTLKMFNNLETQGLKTSPETMYDEMFALTDGKETDVTIRNPSREHAAKHGLWLTSSRSGKGIVEGGINVLSKIEPSKRTVNWVTDEHNFLEKAPVLGRILKKFLPHRELTITPPIYTDLRDKGTKGRGDFSNTGGDPVGHGVKQEEMREFTRQKANPEITKAIKQRALGRGMLTAGALSQGSSVDQQK